MDELTNEIFEQCGCSNEVTKTYITTLLDSIKRFDKKQEVFSTNNISDTGEIGLQTRIGDALSEIRKYLAVDDNKRRELGLNEDKITKDFLDIGIFGFIGYIYRNGKWQ